MSGGPYYFGLWITNRHDLFHIEVDKQRIELLECIEALCQMLGYSPYESSLAPIIVMVGAILFAQK